MARFSKLIILIIILILTLSLLISPQKCIEAGKGAVELCLYTIIPTLFPFLVCSGLFTALGGAALCSRYVSRLCSPLFGLPGSSALSFVLGLTCGYPTGAVCTVDLYTSGNCTKSEAERMLAFCNNSGPLFIIGVVGVGIFGSSTLGWQLYIIHAVSAILCGMLLKTQSKPDNNKSCALPPSVHTQRKNIAFIFGNIIDNSVSSMLKICGFILIFSVIGAVLPQTSATPLLYAILEISGGIKAFAASGTASTLTLAFISFFLAFSGISVLLQVSSVSSDSGLSLKTYFFGKLIQGLIAFGLCYLLFSLFPVAKPTFADSSALLLSGINPKRLLAASFICAAISLSSVLILCFILMLIPHSDD